jgi:hypothetical protein
MNRARRIPLPPPSPDGKRISLGTAYQPKLAAALDAYQDAVVLLAALDPVTTELVRLRCARYHDCHT